MLDQSFECFPCKVQSVEVSIATFKVGNHGKGLSIVIKPAKSLEAIIERPLPRMSEGRVTEVVPERGGFGQILVECQRAGERPRYLGYFQSVGQTGAVVIPLVIDEDLGLVG